MIEVTIDKENQIIGSRIIDTAEFLARGRVTDCTCQLIQCACVEARQHTVNCRYQKALTCAIGFPCKCEDALEVCPKCDACNCGAA